MYDTPPTATQAAPNATLKPAAPSRLPVQMLLAIMAFSMVALVLRWVVMWFTLPHEHFTAYLNNLWQVAAYLPGGLAVDGCCALLMTRWYLQRHNLVDVTRPKRLIMMFLGLYVTAAVLVAVLYNMLWWLLAGWAENQADAPDFTVLMQPLNLLSFVLTTLLPLWLSLHLMRIKGLVQPGQGVVNRGEAALACALLFSAIYVKLLTLVPMANSSAYNGDWLIPVGSAVGLLYGLVALLAAHKALPPQLSYLAIGRLLVSMLLCVSIWLSVALALCFVLFTALLSGSQMLVLSLLLIFWLVLLALLWFMTQLSLRWVYGTSSLR
ncbi:hypothetical protein RRX38_22900 [Pseudomonas sp. DTU_2021_1001937_2_SI_NGA_ILE_001]|uniref:hypothetical protein n=1 Tax=Pseudomonas sp. DTU_2021_1001937_2_SI_NGA_ILE_001 TaxID=3077589 RepID=UPI0028FC228D|nr:hypothetical protein [Pseudomonas sp. DTU_2021_1001937_2_SI_NGA_ILE_001]WNW13882.1 hypothetical protein RRX38_22900 [Pseudomonas sp. DTU_2021_1001937_2_SI_NGA_ILE_001]